ncbi:MAG: DMT family transporter, partial [Alphaproteobacteria bacterium]
SLKNLPAPIRATLWLTLAAIGFPLTITCVRQVVPEIPVLEAVMFRSLFGLVFMLPWLARHGIGQLRTRKTGWLALRGSIAFFVTVFYFMGAIQIPLADLTAITFTRPIFGTIAAVLFLHEIAHARRWSAIMIGFIGMLIIIRPGLVDVSAGIYLVLAGVALQTFNTIIVKMLTRTEKPDLIVIYHTIFILPLAIVPAIVVWQSPTVEQYFWLFAIGALGVTTQRCMTRAFAAADAIFVLAVSYIRLPLAALVGFVIFGEVPQVWVWIGGGVICASSIYIARREAFLARAVKKATP